MPPRTQNLHLVILPGCSSSTKPCAAVQTLVKWWAEYPGELLEARVVKPLQQYLTDELVVTKKLTVSVMNTIKVLAKVEEANQLGRLLPPDAFYNQLIRCLTRASTILHLHLHVLRHSQVPMSQLYQKSSISKSSPGACFRPGKQLVYRVLI